MTVADRIAAFRAALDEWLRGLYHGMITHPAYEKIEKEAEDTEDEFMLACFPDAFGIPRRSRTTLPSCSLTSKTSLRRGSDGCGIVRP